MNQKFLSSLALLLVLAILAATTLDGKIRIATLVFLAGFALKMYLVILRNKVD